MEIVGLVLGLVGISLSIYYGARSKKVEAAFARYVTLDDEVKHLEKKARGFAEKVEALEQQKSDVYRHRYTPKTKAFVPGDRVKLVEVPKDRSWITQNSKIGMTGIVVDYGPGTYEYLVYWSSADYEGRPMDEFENRWQPFYVNKEQIARIG
ncbi:hypothetical protein [Stenotrophomonas maltophilia]|uniref:hypothetical protein n=1 Tax=Stenotrophomonas maltophilia TaxID=40324 RepID=UPI00126020A2|nr:hypothetical protein [Stenotrophomonas maltophilia]